MVCNIQKYAENVFFFKNCTNMEKKELETKLIFSGSFSVVCYLFLFLVCLYISTKYFLKKEPETKKHSFVSLFFNRQQCII